MMATQQETAYREQVKEIVCKLSDALILAYTMRGEQRGAASMVIADLETCSRVGADTARNMALAVFRRCVEILEESS